MDLESAALLVVSIAALFGIVFLALRGSRRAYERLRERAVTVEAAYREVAAKTGLVLRAFDPVPHPIVGPLPTFPKLSGEYRGFGVTVEVEFDSASEGGASCWTRMVLRRRAGAPWPSPGKLRRAKKESRIEPAALDALRVIEPRVRRVAVELGELRVEAGGDRTGSGLSFAYDLLMDPGEIVRLLDDLVALASAL